MRLSVRVNPAGLVAAVAVLVVAGAGHRLLAGRIDALLDAYLAPKQPLASLPLQIGAWAGRDLPVDEKIRRIAGDDDFISREYRDSDTGKTVSVYVGYIGRPRSRLSHRPDVCYPAHGYSEVSRQAIEIPLEGSKAVPALLYEYAPPGLSGSPQVVVATYALNGRWMNDTGAAQGYNARESGLFSHQMAYVARIQVALLASGDEAADAALLSSLASRIVARVRNLLPE